MHFKSNKIPLLILGITAVICSRAMFMLFDDPEGPNLLVVTVMALVIYFLSLAMYSFIATKENTLKHFSVVLPIGLKKLFQIILVQLIVAGAFYLLFNWI